MPVLGALRRAVGVLPLPALHRGAAPTPSARFSGLQCPSRGLCTATPAKRVKGPRHKGPKHVVRKPQLGVAEAQMPPLATVSRSVMPGYVVLEDVRSARNTGHIIRTACVSAMAGVCFTGITSGVSRKVMRASLGAEQCIGLHHGSTVADIVSQLRHDHPDPIVVCVETTPVSVDSRVFFERHAHNIASRGVVLVMGQETTGIPEDTLASIPHHIHLPLRGFKSSLNVSDCAAVIMSQLHVAMLTHAPQAFKQETFADVSLPALRTRSEFQTMRVLGVPAAQGTPVAVVHSGCFDAAASNSHYSQFAPASELSPRRRGLTPQFPVLESHDAQNVNTTGRHGHQQHLHAPRQLAAPAQPAEAPPQQTPQEGDIRVGSTLFNGEYRITGKLGSGTFGDVYEAVYTSTGASVAIKVARSEQHIAQMKKESTAYVHCRAKSGSIHLPRLHWAGPCNSAHIMILELLGKDIHALQQQCGGRFSEQTLSQLALKMLALLHTLHHEARCIHKDVKPANFALKDDEVYLLDLGFTRPWVDANGNHIPYDKNETRFVGTPRFASRASHRGEQSSRRDDLESLVYSLVHMHMGRLPWMHMKHAEEIVSCKDQCAMSPAMLTGGHPYITPLFHHVLSLGFDSQPDYVYLTQLMSAWVSKANVMPGVYDWDARSQGYTARAQPLPLLQQATPSPPVSTRKLTSRPLPPAAPRQPQPPLPVGKGAMGRAYQHHAAVSMGFVPLQHTQPVLPQHVGAFSVGPCSMASNLSSVSICSSAGSRPGTASTRSSSSASHTDTSQCVTPVPLHARMHALSPAPLAFYPSH